MSFWDNVFQATQAPVSPPLTLGMPKAWWQGDDPYGQARGVVQDPIRPQYQEPGLSERELKEIRRRGHQNISSEEAELIAEYDLATKAKHQNRCPECDSGHFIPAGTRVNVGGIGMMPTDKCFDCGYSARGPERAVGASGGGSGSIHTRQIDTGGAGGNSMYMRFNGIPNTYAPRA